MKIGEVKAGLFEAVTKMIEQGGSIQEVGGVLMGITMILAKTDGLTKEKVIKMIDDLYDGTPSLILDIQETVPGLFGMNPGKA